MKAWDRDRSTVKSRRRNRVVLLVGQGSIRPAAALNLDGT